LPHAPSDPEFGAIGWVGTGPNACIEQWSSAVAVTLVRIRPTNPRLALTV
jgi:hypothetical protein